MERQDLFITKMWRMHSGDWSTFKVECDALTTHDWETLARIVSERFTFQAVYGIANGGLKLSEPLAAFCEPSGTIPLLIVDDVFTTGGSMRDARKIYGKAPGVVAFSRGKCPRWVTPVWQLWGRHGFDHMSGVSDTKGSNV